jgi:hypothetical protein
MNSYVVLYGGARARVDDQGLQVVISLSSHVSRTQVISTRQGDIDNCMCARPGWIYIHGESLPVSDIMHARKFCVQRLWAEPRIRSAGAKCKP